MNLSNRNKRTKRQLNQGIKDEKSLTPSSTPQNQNQSTESEIENERSSHITAYQQTWSGPFPSPHVLREYNQIIPNMAERILDNFESQTKHRIEIEKEIVFSRSENMKKGQIFAFIIALCLIALSFYCVYMGYQVLAGTICGTTITGYASAFIYGQHTQKEERKQKREQNQ